MRTKPILAASIFLNLALLGTAGYLLSRKTEAPAAAAPVSVANLSSEAPRAPAAAPFRWSQLEAEDYSTYIANLRAIGCPEQTIRDIIAADVASLYETKRRELESRLAKQTGVPAVATRQALDRLTQGQKAVMAKLPMMPTASSSESQPPGDPARVASREFRTDAGTAVPGSPTAARTGPASSPSAAN